jgi:hypothetical protein
VAELVTGVCQGDWIGPFGNAVTGELGNPLTLLQRLGIQAKVGAELPVKHCQMWLRHRFRKEVCKE